jgi:hypothetical protein
LKVPITFKTDPDIKKSLSELVEIEKINNPDYGISTLMDEVATNFVKGKKENKSNSQT